MLRNILTNYFDEVVETPWDGPQPRASLFISPWPDIDFEAVLEPQGITAKCVDNYGGEDAGSTYYAVWKFTKGDDHVFYRFDAWYASYDGPTYESYREVHPKVVTKVEYD